MSHADVELIEALRLQWEWGAEEGNEAGAR